MENLNELQVKEQLEKLVEIIERERWTHLYEKCETPMTSALVRLRQENGKAAEVINEQKEEIDELKKKIIALSAQNEAAKNFYSSFSMFITSFSKL